MSELYRYTFDLEALARQHPPLFRGPNKKVFFTLVAGDDPTLGAIEVTRWPRLASRLDEARYGLDWLCTPASSPTTPPTLPPRCTGISTSLTTSCSRSETGRCWCRTICRSSNTPTSQVSGSPSLNGKPLPACRIGTVLHQF